MIARLLAILLLLIPVGAAAEIRLPAGFTAQVYVTGEGFDTDATRGIRGIPATSTLAFDQAGSLYLARTGRSETFEGERTPPQTMLLIEWPSREAAHEFYESEEYRPYREARRQGSRGVFMLVAGEDAAARPDPRP